MQLTRYTDYGLRILIYLALLPNEQRASIDQISETYGISRNNVNKIVHQLGKEGVIVTMRGKGGGFTLNKPPKEINIGQMVRLLEHNLQVIDCHKPSCKILPACKLKHVLHQATQAFLATLSEYSLADLLEGQETALIHLLALPGQEHP